MNLCLRYLHRPHPFAWFKYIRGGENCVFGWQPTSVITLPDKVSAVTAFLFPIRERSTRDGCELTSNRSLLTIFDHKKPIHTTLNHDTRYEGSIPHVPLCPADVLAKADSPAPLRINDLRKSASEVQVMRGVLFVN